MEELITNLRAGIGAPQVNLAVQLRAADVRRSKDRDLTFYPVNTISSIQCNSECPNTLRYVVTADYQLVLSPEGKPSKTIPQHLEMTNGQACIAAGNIYLSDTSPKKICGINHQSGDFHSGIDSLIWPLTIISQHPELIHSNLAIQTSAVTGAGVFHNMPIITVTTEQLLTSLSQVWSHDDLRLGQINRANQATASVKYTYQHADAFTAAGSGFFPRQAAAPADSYRTPVHSRDNSPGR